MNEERKNITVSEYLKLVNDTLAIIPSDQIFIVGEISDYRVSQGKWINFDLKDEEKDAKIPCFGTTFQIKAPLESGMKVKIVGQAKVYERFGKFSLNVQSIELVGEGALQKAYELLKKKLEAEGLFDVSRKRKIPRFPNKIGLITSREAAAYGDFLRILNVIVLTRGGGSLEDLHAFNDEAVARAVFQSSIPVVVGVGHERDESLCDFVSDIRASTPSNAAELVSPNRLDIEREYKMMIQRIDDRFNNRIAESGRKIERSIRVLDKFVNEKMNNLRITIERFGSVFERFQLNLAHTRQRVDRNHQAISRTFREIYLRTSQATKDLIRIFENFDVQRILDRGFSIVRKDKVIIRDGALLAKGDEIDIQLAKNNLHVKVQK